MGSIKDERGYNQGFERTATFHKRIERRATWMLQEVSQLNSKSQILEIGCGTGEISNFLAKHTPAKITGIDISESFIELANKDYMHPNLTFKVEDFLKSDLKPNTFDYIVGNGILHHLYYNLDESLIRIREVLKHKGKIIFLEPNIYNPYCFLIFKYLRQWAKLDPEEMAFSRKFIKNKLLQNSYSNIKANYKDFLVPVTPFFMVPFVSSVSNFAEKIFPINRISQSIYIVAVK